MTTAVIVDMDGTLCDVSTALHHLAGKRRNFHAFHRATRRCPPTPQAVDYCRRAHDAGHVVCVVAGLSVTRAQNAAVLADQATGCMSRKFASRPRGGLVS